MRQMICEVEQYFDKEFDGTLNRVMRVLHVCNSIEEAEDIYNIIDPTRYGDYSTTVRIVSEDTLDKTFR